MPITLEEVQRYETDGFLFPIPILEEEQARQVRYRFDQLEAKLGREESQVAIVDAHFSERFVWEIATNSTILDAVEAVIGPNILLLGTHFICKYGQTLSTESFFAWHQDLTYWGLEPPVVITAWYAIDDADTGNGCMQMISGTHRHGIREHGKSSRPGNLLRINQAVAVTEVDDTRAADIVLRAGEISLHDGLVLHGSPPNLSNRRRCGLAMKYVPTNVKQSMEEAHTRSKAILVRGEDREQHFFNLDRPFH